ncbi:hypothetical protein [Pseudoalteromonas sp.]|uniref:hypothetical protein n=1 Tax=Pseudoalteromonas sp. TaxID=53249 RepID=UPI00356B5451
MKTITSLFSLILCLLITGCYEQTPTVDNSPGDTAIAFFDALYNQNDLQKATTMATPRLARVMKSYGTVSQVTRTLFNMQFDQVLIEVDMSNMSLRQQYADKAQINIIFTGTFNGKKIDDMRSVQLLYKKRNWYVNKILSDPYAR